MYSYPFSPVPAVFRAKSVPLAAPPSVEQRERPSLRLLNVVVDPPTAFRGIDEDPRWGLAFLAVVTLRFGSLFAFYRPMVTPLKVLGGLLFQVSAVGPPLLLAATVLWVAARMAELRVKWRVSYSIVTHVYVAYTLATVLIASAAGAFLPQSIDVDLRNPPFTNLRFLAGDTANHVVRKLLEQIDIRSAYALLLVWLALRQAVARAERRAVTGAVTIFAAVRVLTVVAIAAFR